MPAQRLPLIEPIPNETNHNRKLRKRMSLAFIPAEYPKQYPDYTDAALTDCPQGKRNRKMPVGTA